MGARVAAEEMASATLMTASFGLRTRLSVA
jgi:hypothetical protein